MGKLGIILEGIEEEEFYSLKADPKRMIRKRSSTILVKWIKIFGMNFTAYLIDLLKVLVKG